MKVQVVNKFLEVSFYLTEGELRKQLTCGCQCGRTQGLGRGIWHLRLD